MKKNGERKIGKGYFGVIAMMASLSLKKLPGAFALMFFTLGFSGLVQGAAVWFKQNFFDKAALLLAGGSAETVYVAGILLGLWLMLKLLLRAAEEPAMFRFFNRLRQEAGGCLNEKAARVDPIVYEDSSFLDCVEKAGNGISGVCAVFQISMNMAVILLFYFGFMGAYLFRIEKGLLVMLCLSFLPYLVSGFVRYRLSAQKEQLSAPYRRRGEYYGKCITDREYAKETRLLGAYGYFFRLFEENISMVRKLDWQSTRKRELVEIALRFISMLGYLGMIALLFCYLMQGRVSVGEFAAVASSLDALSDKLDVMFRTQLVGVIEETAMAGNYIAFLNLPERERGETFPECRQVEFDKVSFTYPHAVEPALKKVSFTIRENETVAIVGSNGAGKSTLARLLLGIYRPGEGSVYLDGVDTRDLNPRYSTGKLSAVFQKFQKYKMTLRDNVYLSDTRGPLEENRILEALDKANLDYRGEVCPEGLETMLSREFGGTDLSGGQWQRLAIARGLYRRHNLIVLDEPTAAIDPLEETAVYRKFAELSKDKTAVIITHRLGSARIADRILVLDEGRLAEEGSHEELLAQKGLYYEMYTAQAKWYA